MHRINSATAADLYDIAASRRIEQAAAAALPPHELMRRAGLAVARLAMALTPHARTVWIACGPGNNGGDGFEAAAQLRARGFDVVVTQIGDPTRLPTDALASLQTARDAGATFATAAPPHHDLAIDALLGIGAARPPEGLMAEWLRRMHGASAPVLCVDTPSGLSADTGVLATDFLDSTTAGTRRYCLSLLTLKPGLFTAQGGDAAGEIWFDNLGVASGGEPPCALLAGKPVATQRRHASHKGSYGDVAVVGGAAGMAGAALLAASAALAGGAGRVFLAALDPAASGLGNLQPALMLRDIDSLDFASMAVVCGCGGGDAVREVLPRVLRTAASLVLDADALNAIARDAALAALLAARADRGAATVLTPHPLEAARLLGTDTAAIQGDRLGAARALADLYRAVVVLKGSGSVIAAPGTTPLVNASGNARLATAGTGDVLAGMVGALLATGRGAESAACEAVWRHGDLADRWPSSVPLTADALARGAVPMAA